MTASGAGGSTRTLAQIALRQEVEELLYDEAALLDDWQLDDWLQLFTEDAHYIVPTTDLPEGNPREHVVLIDDDIVRLRARVVRLKSRHAHREYPWSRTRRLVTNVRIKQIAEDELLASASCLVYRFRNAQEAPYIGHYEYRLKRVDGSLKIKYRKAVLDMESLHAHGAVSIIL